MTNLARLDDRRQAAAAPQPLSLPRTIELICEDSPYRLQPWSAGDAVHGLTDDAKRDVIKFADQVQRALNPCDRVWLKKRLSAMALAFGHERDPDRVTAWLAETGRLLLDLPQDILADAIDEAIKRSERGFMPAVGQIRAIADPAVAIRRQQANRLDGMASIIGRPDLDGAKVVRPWESPATAPADGDVDRIPADRIAAFNRNMRKFGCSTRCDADGRTFELATGQADPAS